MAGLGTEDLLVVVSGYGMEPLRPRQGLIERLIGDPEISGTHEAAPEVFLLAYGASVARGVRRSGRRSYDVTPTISISSPADSGATWTATRGPDFFSALVHPSRARSPSYRRMTGRWELGAGS